MRPLMHACSFMTALVIGSSAVPGYAHEPFTQEVMRFLQEHPNAGPREIEIFKKTLMESDRRAFEAVETTKREEASAPEVSQRFVHLGMEHILGGLDHVLFVLSLLLVSTKLKHLLKLVSSFTIAHSVTLLLAGTGILTLSSRIVEPLIALSIAWVAITAVFFRDHPLFGAHRHTMGMIFFFGLFHGLGFAGLLEELAVPPEHFLLALLMFNIGIELGQMTILIPGIPAMTILSTTSYYSSLRSAAALGISLLAVIWFTERVLDITLLGF